MGFEVEEIPKQVVEIFENYIVKIRSGENMETLQRFKIHNNFKEFDKNDGDSLRLVKGDNTKTIVAKIKSEF